MAPARALQLAFLALALAALAAAPVANAADLGIKFAGGGKVYDVSGTLYVNWTFSPIFPNGSPGAPTNGTPNDICTILPASCLLTLYGFNDAGDYRAFPSTTSLSKSTAGSHVAVYYNQT